EVEAATDAKIRALGLEPARIASVRRVRDQLTRLIRRGAPAPKSAEAREAAQLISILAGYPDRVGRVRRPPHGASRTGREIVFAAGGAATLSSNSVLGDVDLAVAVDVEERTEGRQSKTVVRAASAIEADWLLDLFTDAISDSSELEWNEDAERVELVR